MPRTKVLTDEQRAERKKLSNDKPENKQKRRENSILYYYKKKLEKAYSEINPPESNDST
jgi:hypothetical protein